MDIEGNLNFDVNQNSHQNETGDFNDLITQLTREKEQLVAEGRYLEAENVKLRINELKGNMTGQKKKDLDLQHAQEMQGLEENFNKEIFELNQKWDGAFQEITERAKKKEEALSIKHKAEMDELIQNLEAKLPKQVKFSKEYLDLKQSEMNLVKQERFVEAHWIKSKCDDLEVKEAAKHNKERDEKMKVKVDQLAQKQNQERNALKNKIDIEFEIMGKTKNDEIEKIVLKYKNKKLQLEAQHKEEKFLTENENILKAKTSTGQRFSNTAKNYNSGSNFYSNQKYSSPSKLKYYQTEMKMKELAKQPFRKADEQYTENNKYVSDLNDNVNVSEKENSQHNYNMENQNHYEVSHHSDQNMEGGVDHNENQYLQGEIEVNQQEEHYDDHVDNENQEQFEADPNQENQEELHDQEQEDHQENHDDQ